MIRMLLQSTRNTFPRGFCIAALILGVTAALPVHAGGIEGLSYSLTPGVEYMQWNSDIALEDDIFYGGRLGLNFGKFVSLRGFYFGNTDVEMILPEGAEGDPGHVDVANYGADLALQFPRGSILPFVYGGGGIYRFDTDGGERSKKIGLKMGGGVRFAPTQRTEAVVYVEDALIRTGAGLLAEDPENNDDLEHNIIFGAGLNFFLGGYRGETEADRELQNKFSGGITGATWVIEPFAGKLEWDSGVDLGDIELLGARTGIGFGPFVDLRGYYWRGMESDFGKTEQIQSYGIESQFNLNPSPGVEPHILLGVGNIDFMSGFEDAEDVGRKDEMVLIAGGGVSFTLADRWRVNLDARDYMFGPSDLEETEDLDELFHNWTYTAGMTFTFGGRSDAPETTMDDIIPVEETQPVATVMSDEKPVSGKVVVETVTVEKEVLKETANAMVSPVRTFQGDRVVTIPVPTVGEIYVRYGDPGAVTIETTTETDAAPMKAAPIAPVEKAPDSETAPASGDLSAAEKDAMRKAIRAVLQEEMKAAHDSMRTDAAIEVDGESLANLEERLARQIDDRVDQRVREKGVTLSPAGGTASTAGTAGVAASPSSAPGRGFVMREYQVYSGGSIDKPNQWIIGGRLSMQREGGTMPVYWVPEIAFGLLDKNSTLLAMNLVYDLGDRIEVNGVRPYVSAGAGVLFFNKKIDDREKREGVLNLGYGLKKKMGGYDAFIEHQGIDLYSLHRLLAGVSWNM